MSDQGDQSQDASQAGQDAANKAIQGAKKAADAAKVAGKLVASGGTDVKSWLEAIKKYGIPVVGFIMVLNLIIVGLIVALFVTIFTAASAQAQSCTNGGSTSIAVLATNGPVNVGSTYMYPSKPPSKGTISAEMMGNAQLIVKTAQARKPPAPDKAIVIALATALVESQLINSNVATDHDSLGLFQQRPSQGWGTPQQITDPTYATNIFIDRLLGVPNWDVGMSPGAAAQKVQRSAFPDRYDAVMSTAAGLAQSITSAFSTAGVSNNNGSTNSADPNTQLAATSTTYILGDSITVQNKDKYNQLFSGKGVTPTISAVVGRSWTTPGSGNSVGTTGSAKSAVQTDQAAIQKAGSIIIALGTNGGLGMNPVDEIVTTIRGMNANAPIYWINIAGTSPNVAPNVVAFNNKLSEVQNTGKIRIINWANSVDPSGDGTHDPSNILSDGIHPNGTGNTKLVDLVGTTYDAIQGTGSYGCSGYADGNGGDPSACPPDTFYNPTTFRNSTASPHDLCVKSVLQARSPQAGKAIMWAFNHVGIPYGRPDGVCSTSTTRTGPDHYDCSGFTTSAYSQTGTNVGGNPSTSVMQSNWPQAYEVTADQARPGDLLLPSTGHVVMILADNMIVHTNKCGDVSHIRSKYTGGFMKYYAIKTPAAAA